MGQWGRRKNIHRASWVQLPLMIILAFLIDLALLALTLFVGQLAIEMMNAGSRHHRPPARAVPQRFRAY